MMGLPLFMICGFSLQYFNTFFCIFNVSSIIWYVEFLVWSYLFGVLCVFLYLSKYIFSQFGEVFFYDLGEDLIYTIHLGFIFSFYACDSWMLYVHNQCSYIFLLCVFGFVFYHFFHWQSKYSTLSSGHGILFPVDHLTGMSFHISPVMGSSTSITVSNFVLIQGKAHTPGGSKSLFKGSKYFWCLFWQCSLKIIIFVLLHWGCGL